MLKCNQLIRVSRGIYSLPDRSVAEHTALAELSKVYPRLLYYLISALQFHGLTIQLPHEIWVALPNRARRPVATH